MPEKIDKVEFLEYIDRALHAVLASYERESYQPANRILDPRHVENIISQEMAFSTYNGGELLQTMACVVIDVHNHRNEALRLTIAIETAWRTFNKSITGGQLSAQSMS